MRVSPSFDRAWPKLLVTVILPIAAASWASHARAQIVDAAAWTTNGWVNAMARDGNTLYIGGFFSAVGPGTGMGVPLNAVTGEVVRPFPGVTFLRSPVLFSGVNAVVPDGAGGWFIGGRFSAVGGQARSGLAHIRADGSLGPSPNVQGPVLALAVSGTTVYVGGSFTTIGDQPRSRIAAWNSVNGSVTAWNPGADGPVNALVVHGGVIYAGGAFTQIGGQARAYLAALNASDGTATAWNPGPEFGSVSDLVASGNTVYASGNFTSIRGVARKNIAALDVVTGSVTNWDPNPDGLPTALGLRGGKVYVAGAFTSIGGAVRNGIAALDSATGLATDWDPNTGGGISALAVGESGIYVGGSFTTIGGVPRNRLAALDATTGALTDWDPPVDNTVQALAVSGGTVYAGGRFSIVGSVPRRNLAALDVSTGLFTDWNPEADEVVNALVAGGGKVYAGGYFSSVGGQPRAYLAAMDATTGAVTPWNPSANHMVHALALDGGTVYVGGEFGSIGGVPTSWGAAVDTAAGNLLPWYAFPDGTIRAFLLDGNTLYVGGEFTSLGQQPRNCLAALATPNGLASPWDPGIEGGDSFVWTLARSGNTIYAGGRFSEVGGEERRNAVALNTTTGAPTAWNPTADHHVLALAVSEGTVYLGGAFRSIGGQPRHGLAAVDATTGALTSWDPNPEGSYYDQTYSAIHDFAVEGNTVYVGGDFFSIGGHPQGGLARLADVTTGTLLTRFDADVLGQGVLLRWRFQSALPVVRVLVERAERESGPWSSLVLEPRDQGGEFTALDGEAEQGRDYWYRLTALIAGGATANFGPIRAEVPGSVAESGPTRVWPNPGSEKIRIDYVVARRERVRFTVLDVAGREIEVLAEGDMEPGRYTASWDGRRGSVALESGVYFLRWQSPGKSAERRFVLVR